MKKIMKIILPIALIIAVTFSIINFVKFKDVLISTTFGPKAETRISLAQAVKVDNENLTLKTADGMYWTWNIEPGECFTANKLYFVTFNTLNTPGYNDDIIVNIIEK